MENGRVYWVVEKYDDYADHPNDRGWKRYDEETFYLTETACQEEVDNSNGPQKTRAAKAYERETAQWEQNKADFEVLVAAGRREGPYSVSQPRLNVHLEYRVGTAHWNEKQEGDKITIEVY